MSKLIFATCLLIFSFEQAFNKKDFTCNLVKEILDNKIIQRKLKIDKKSYSNIRIVSLVKKLPKCACKHKFGYSTISYQIPLDYNSGQYIDFGIVGFKKFSKSVSLEIVIIQTGSSPCKWIGEIEFIRDGNDLTIENVEFYLVS